MLETYRRSYPKSEFGAEITRKLAVAYGEAGRPGNAAVEFEHIAANPAEERGVRREAVLQSAELYAKAGNTPKAVGMLEQFIADYPAPLADAEEARQKLADISARRAIPHGRPIGFARL